ncbi:protein NCBP2AS2 homolog isoform X1 [Octopus bimaculoides]|uniref:Uncharacterized protein n=1 Tax=Octopus bimaculoides TaxID=37653 RepID=A0A0L8G8U9_OCTBM|nr:protein NCBP2AS2 homolog isoform X1 [Octopus bimaculoides]|eukprot:XP_014783189.1 PREDICTED: uncharacterized protein NCBP2-AS2 homolog isoform X1 [Octopus bimaculoides]
MVLRIILRYLLHNEHLVQKLSESYPIRRSAQLVAYIFLRGKEKGLESIEKLKDHDSVSPKRLQSFKKTFQEKLQEGIREWKQKNP